METGKGILLTIIYCTLCGLPDPANTKCISDHPEPCGCPDDLIKMMCDFNGIINNETSRIDKMISQVEEAESMVQSLLALYGKFFNSSQFLKTIGTKRLCGMPRIPKTWSKNKCCSSRVCCHRTDLMFERYVRVSVFLKKAVLDEDLEEGSLKYKEKLENLREQVNVIMCTLKHVMFQCRKVKMSAATRLAVYETKVPSLAASAERRQRDYLVLKGLQRVLDVTKCETEALRKFI